MADIILDRAISKPIRHRIGREGYFFIRFFLNLEKWPIPAEVFELLLRKANELDIPVNVFKLTIGDGLTIGTGDDTHQMKVTISAARARLLEVRKYHWQLFNATRLETWINGWFEAHNGNFNAGQPFHIDVKLSLADNVINVNLTIEGTAAPAGGLKSDDDSLSFKSDDDTLSLKSDDDN